ncbi:hypothetical protein KBD71_02835 [Candidatus Woesebacteria bacterium]|nr:hypothetical protein [Candidatus Woesebacteria bacterium]
MTTKPVTYLYSPHQLGVEADINRSAYAFEEVDALSQQISRAIFELLIKSDRISDFNAIDWNYDIGSQQFVVTLSKREPRT